MSSYTYIEFGNKYKINNHNEWCICFIHSIWNLITKTEEKIQGKEEAKIDFSDQIKEGQGAGCGSCGVEEAKLADLDVLDDPRKKVVDLVLIVPGTSYFEIK